MTTTDKELSLIRRFRTFLKEYMRYCPKLSSDDVKLEKSSSCDNLTLSSYTSSNYSTNYSSRDKSLDLTRNSENDYEVVLPYQRIAKPAKKHEYKLPKNNNISLFTDNHNIKNYDLPGEELNVINNLDFN